MIGKKVAREKGNHSAGIQEIVWTTWCKCRSESRVVIAASLPWLQKPVTPPGKGRRTGNRT